MRRILQDCRGDISVVFLGSILALTMISGLVSEYLRLHAVADRVEKQLLQAVNVAVETAMWDSVRIDGGGAMDEAAARDAFQSYLTEVMGLTALAAQSPDGGVQYRLSGLNLNVAEEPPAITLVCSLEVPSMFSFLPVTTLPLRVSSRNVRLD